MRGEIEVFADRDPEYAGCWRVEVIDMEGEGACWVAVFSGPDSEARAKAYGDWIRPLVVNSTGSGETGLNYYPRGTKLGGG